MASNARRSPRHLTHDDGAIEPRPHDRGVWQVSDTYFVVAHFHYVPGRHHRLRGVLRIYFSFPTVHRALCRRAAGLRGPLPASGEASAKKAHAGWGAHEKAAAMSGRDPQARSHPPTPSAYRSTAGRATEPTSVRAGRAEAEQFDGVVDVGVAVLLRDLAGPALDRAPLDLLGAAARPAHQVVVVPAGRGPPQYR